MTAPQSRKHTWREALANERPLILPGAYDALSARLIERAGFSALVTGGYSLVASRFGVPDIGLMGLAEMAETVRPIVSATPLPLLMDADNGYGDAKNVTRTVETYEAMGVAAILLEDQVSPKRCGHMAGKSVVPVEEMERKLRAAVAARRSRDFFIIARTDARGVHGLDDALRRGERYLKAGADGLFVEAPQSVEELEIVGRSFDVPQACNMLIGGSTPILPDAELAAMGFSMIFHATDLVMRAAKVLAETLSHMRHGEPDPGGYASFAEFQTILGFEHWQAIEAQAES